MPNWPKSTDAPLVWAEYYIAELGWGLSHFEPGTKGPGGKSWNTPERWIDTREKAVDVWSRHATHGMGVIHSASGTVAIDIDDVRETRRVFREFGLDIDALLQDAPRIRGKRSGRDKAIFRAPDGDPLPMHKVAWRHPSDPSQSITLFELRSGAVHDCLPPSLHPDGHRYEWTRAPWQIGFIAQLPEELLAFWRELPELRDAISLLAPWATEAAAPVLPSLPRAEDHNDVIGAFNRAHSIDALLRANGYARKGNRYLSPTSKSKIPGVSILPDGRVYSHHASDPLGDGHAHDAFDIFTRFDHAGDQKSALRAASELLNLPVYGGTAPALDFSELIANATKKRAAAAVEKPTFPKRLLGVPGLIGDIATYINQTARYPQPVLALAAAIAAAATFMGRKVRTESDLRSNIYILGVAEAGSGKEHARQALRTIFDLSGAFKRVSVEGIASDAALNTALVATPSSLFLLDEVGRLLAVLNDARAGSHLSEVITQLLKVYSAAAGPFCGKVYADADRNTVVQQPNLSIYGTTVPSVFYGALTTSQIEDGFLSRLLVFESEDADPEPRDLVAQQPAHSLIEQCQAWERMSECADPTAVGNIDAVMRPSPRIVSPDPQARVLLSRFERDMRERRRQLRAAGKPAALYVRTAATAQKLALIRAAGRNMESPVIDGDDAEWGCAVALYLADSMAWHVLAHVSENTTERHVKRVAGIIRAAGGAGIARSELTRKTYWLKRGERDDVIQALLQAGEIVARREDGTTRPIERFVSVEYAVEAPASVTLTDAGDTSNTSNPEFETSLVANA